VIPSAFRTVALGSAAAMAFSLPGAAQELSNPQSEFVDNLPPQVWVAKTERTERGHRIGKPDADAQLIEFISYTCGHCADFAKQADGTLDLAAVGPGYVAVEVRPVIRNYLDLVVTMMVQCGEPEGFKNRHRAFLYSQEEWLNKAINAPQSQQAIWSRGDAAARANAARALDLDDTLLAQGLTAPQINACLADDAAAQKIVANGQADAQEFGIKATPTFALDGEVLDGTYSWPALSTVLQERFRPPSPESTTEGTGLGQGG
jgi:protein-disulfide isomerase